jgi:DNA-binding NarL/FixJ family response regulator
MHATDATVVWLVEDNRMLRQSLTSVINGERDMNCPVSVGSVEEMLGSIEEGHAPDIVLMDLGLPGLSGIEGIRRLRSLLPAARAVVLTVHEERQNVFDAICAGASGYLLKPSNPGGVIDAIRQVRDGGAPINAYIAQKMLSMFAKMAPPSDPEYDYHLTTREREVLELLVDGLSMQQIADRLNRSYHTIDNHLRNIYEKLHVHSRASAVAKAVKEGLI